MALFANELDYVIGYTRLPMDYNVQPQNIIAINHTLFQFKANKILFGERFDCMHTGVWGDEIASKHTVHLYVG